MAQRNLRCLGWASFPLELMTSGSGVSAYSQSRPLRAGEQIDFCVIHSWHDDPVAKWDVLQRLAAQFSDKHGREPTFWLDKACIDQSSIGDGLRTLIPIEWDIICFFFSFM